uniref:Uncharacterized protein n=1 Tax=Oryza glumipatula TaxID=40148 RepID=A0A0E0B889_9ORYZ
MRRALPHLHDSEPATLVGGFGQRLCPHSCHGARVAEAAMDSKLHDVARLQRDAAAVVEDLAARRRSMRLFEWGSVKTNSAAARTMPRRAMWRSTRRRRSLMSSSDSEIDENSSFYVGGVNAHLSPNSLHFADRCPRSSWSFSTIKASRRLNKILICVFVKPMPSVEIMKKLAIPSLETI